MNDSRTSGRLVMLDDHKQQVSAGDFVRFAYGIPPVYVHAKIVQRGKSLIALTPGHNPPECHLRRLRRLVGAWFRHNDNFGAGGGVEGGHAKMRAGNPHHSPESAFGASRSSARPARTSKRKKPFPATLASEKALTADGWTVGRVEQRIPGCWITRDLYGFADLIACSPTRGILLVQVTGGRSTSNFNARVAKVKAEPRAAIWLASGGRIQVHSHETVAGTKERKLRVLEITRQ